MAMFDLNYTPNHTKLGSSVNVKHFFSSPLSAPPPSVCVLAASSAGHMFKWWRGNLQFFNVLWRPEPCPTPPTERDWSHPQLSQDLICTPHPSHTQIRLSLLWLIRRTGSTLIRIRQWLGRANCRRLLCIDVLIMYIIFLSHSSLGCLFYSTVFSNILKLQQWWADVTLHGVSVGDLKLQFGGYLGA